MALSQRADGQVRGAAGVRRGLGLAGRAPTNRRPGRAQGHCVLYHCPTPTPRGFGALPPSSLQEQESLEEARRRWLGCPAAAEGARPGPAS